LLDLALDSLFIGLAVLSLYGAENGRSELVSLMFYLLEGNEIPHLRFDPQMSIGKVIGLDNAFDRFALIIFGLVLERLHGPCDTSTLYQKGGWAEIRGIKR
ncbi:MAG: hypothetical protein U1C97_01820, partial [Candidatus Gracilibacteria bacterium]|nr:hypothetical protein [Candidatus Gracilibacteria bacterium]